MSEEQPSGKNRVCAIYCRLFLLGYSSNIGFFLAYAFSLASDTAYSSSPRAPSPRVPPDAWCAALCHYPYVISDAPPCGISARRLMPCGKCARVNMYRSSRWGASRLWAAALSSLPASSGFSPSAGGLSCASSLAPAAHARPCALTLIPPGFVLLCGRARPTTLLTCAGVPLSLAFPPHLCAPLRCAHTLANLPPCALRYAPRAHPSPASMESQTVGRRG